MGGVVAIRWNFWVITTGLLVGRSTSHEISVSGRWRCYFANSGEKSLQDFKYFYGQHAARNTVQGTVKSLLSYTRVFEEYYGVRFVDVHIMYIVAETMSSNILTANYRRTYKRPTRVGIIRINGKVMHLLLANLGGNASVAKTGGRHTMIIQIRTSGLEGKSFSWFRPLTL